MRALVQPYLCTALYVATGSAVNSALSLVSGHAERRLQLSLDREECDDRAAQKPVTGRPGWLCEPGPGRISIVQCGPASAKEERKNRGLLAGRAEATRCCAGRVAVRVRRSWPSCPALAKSRRRAFLPCRVAGQFLGDPVMSRAGEATNPRCCHAYRRRSRRWDGRMSSPSSSARGTGSPSSLQNRLSWRGDISCHGAAREPRGPEASSRCCLRQNASVSSWR
jgi:hypothetical protein